MRRILLELVTLLLRPCLLVPKGHKYIGTVCYIYAMMRTVQYSYLPIQRVKVHKTQYSYKCLLLGLLKGGKIGLDGKCLV